LASTQGKTSNELREIVRALGAQIHDVSVRLGNNPGFVGSYHDSAWDGITLVNEKLEVADKSMEKRIALLVEESVRSSVQSQLDVYTSGERLSAAIAHEIARGNDESKELTARKLKILDANNRALEAKNAMLTADITELRTQMKTLPPDFGEDWKLVFDFFVRNTKPANPPRIGGQLEDAVSNNSVNIKKLSSNLDQIQRTSSGTQPSSLSSRLSGIHQNPLAPRSEGAITQGSLATIEAQVLDLQARLESKAVAIDNYTFPTLAGTTKWAVANLPSDPDKALICVDVVALLHSIGREFATTEETRDTLYQNKQAGVSTMAITVSSSFQTVLPQIMGKNSKTGGEDAGLTLPCATKYSEWFDNSEGIPTGTISQGSKKDLLLRRQFMKKLFGI
jgi:hypothetical protein